MDLASQTLYKTKSLIVPEMADPNHVQPRYRSQEVSLANARTSGIFLCRTKIRELRQFPGATKKTLHGQSLESVFVPETLTLKDVEVGELGPLLWPAVRPPRGD